MASKKSYLESLRRVSLFSSCSNKDLEKIAKAGDEVTMAAGSLFVDQGQTGREAFVILKGSATVRRNGKKVATLGPGSVVGELSLLDHGPRTASVVADTDCVMLVISQRQFLGVLDSIPALSHKMLATLAGRIRELDRQYFG
ncbi:MAG: Crp/Fnr family transcriptional regulator [Actinomycetota bacterium]